MEIKIIVNFYMILKGKIQFLINITFSQMKVWKLFAIIQIVFYALE